MIAREPRCQYDERTAMSATLHVSPDGHPAENRLGSRDIDPHDADWIATVKQELRIVTGSLFVRTVLVVSGYASRFEQNTATNVVVDTPGRCFDRRHENVVVIHDVGRSTG